MTHLHKNALIGNQLCCLFQFRQGCARSDTLLEYWACFHLCCWWQRGTIRYRAGLDASQS